MNIFSKYRASECTVAVSLSNSHWSLEMIYGPNAERQIIFYGGLGVIAGIIVVIVLKGLGIA